MGVYDNNRNVLEELKTVSLVIKFHEILRKFKFLKNQSVEFSWLRWEMISTIFYCVTPVLTHFS